MKNRKVARPRPLRGAVFGAGFWTRYQLAAWRELGGVEFAAIYNRTRAKAEAIAQEFGIPAVYDDASQLLREVRPDFVDNITEVGGHKPLSLLCARARVPCICQKPMASSLADARTLVAAFARTKTPFFVHENWRWQAPLRELKRVLDAGLIGEPFRGRLTMISGFEGWKNQPALRELEQFILTDLGTHLFDAARCLFGEAHSLYGQTARTLPEILKGENVCTALLTMGQARTQVVVEMAYARTPLERECFPQTLAFVEGPRGSVEITNDYWVRVTTARGTQSQRHAPARYAWADPQYDIAHASIVECHRDLRRALRGERRGETTGADNLKTLELVFACYESAAKGKVLHFP
jgi:predicted dehydrogenase